MSSSHFTECTGLLMHLVMSCSEACKAPFTQRVWSDTDVGADADAEADADANANTNTVLKLIP